MVYEHICCQHAKELPGLTGTKQGHPEAIYLRIKSSL